MRQGVPEESLGPNDAPADRFCDIVMEGGVTSGIIYASAVAELARHYRFRSIGGSSIGAFAAALTAAAEYRRRKGYSDGFDLLAQLPQQLAELEEGRTRLERMFVPQPGTRRLFSIFRAMLNRRGPVSSAAAAFRAALCAYKWRVAAVSLLLVLIVLGGPVHALYACASAQSVWERPDLGVTHLVISCDPLLASWFTALLPTLGVAVLGTVLTGIIMDFHRGVVPNGFGLCRGWDAKNKADSPDLAAYLDASIQRVAGRKPHEPLTFRDLWDAPGQPGKVLGFKAEGAATRSINLEVYASNLAHSRPYRFPLEETDDMGRLFFLREELEEYFPAHIVLHLVRCSKRYKRRSNADPEESRVADRQYLELPVEDLPVVVAARLAMSFPVLISAVPLYAVDHARQAMRRCWMSDGGLCSNFPIHLFDSFLPMWPTFGISLTTREEGDERIVVLPERHTSGRGEIWDRAPEEGFWKMARFLLSLCKTATQWNDRTMMRMPAVRDRVVRVFLAPGEGGVNIRMPPDQIRRLGTCYGTPAAKAFVSKFIEREGWQEHRWVRLNCLLISLRDRMRLFTHAADLSRHTTPLRAQIAAAQQVPPLRRPTRRTYRLWPSEEKLTPQEAQDLNNLLQALRGLEDAYSKAPRGEPYRAIPRPALRSRHPT